MVAERVATSGLVMAESAAVELAAPESAAMPSSALLAALSRAFSYPWNGIEETFAVGQEPEAEQVSALCSTLRAAAAESFTDDTAAQLAYTRLFIGSFKMEAPPYASYYLEESHTLGGRAAVEVAAVYAQFGLELDAREKAPADYLRYLLAFLALLAARFEETGEAAFAEAYADFRDAYVTTWIRDFQQLVERYAEGAYYPTLVALIVDALECGKGTDTLSHSCRESSSKGD